MNLNVKVKEILLENVSGLKEEMLKDNSPLITTGYIDSFEIIKLLELFEKNFNITIDIEKISLSNFETIENMVKLVSDTKETLK